MLTIFRRVAAAAAAAALATAAACSSSAADGPPASTPVRGSAAAFPVTIRAANGPVTIESTPHAIVSLSPTATEMLFAIGAGGQVKAVDKDSDYPANAPHTDLDAFDMNVEAVASYHPDLVVASNLTRAQLKQLHTLQIPTLEEPAATDLNDTYAQLSQLGRATGRSAGAGTEVADMKRKVAAIVASTPDKPASYYYELDQTYYSVTSATFIGHVLRLVGLTSIADAAKGAAASGGYPQLSGEFILKADPGYVLLADTKCCKQSAATVAKRPGWSAMSAVQDGRVIALDDDIASRWGPRIVDLLRTVANAVRQHPVS